MFKKILTSSLLTLVAFGGFFGISLEQRENVPSVVITSTYAADAAKTTEDAAKAKTTEDADMKKALNSIVNVLNIILSILTIIVTPAIMLASWLMSPDWTAGDIFGIRPVLHDLWITISNITYFVYAILLIFIAIATIFNSEHYGYKSMLPKLALGIILVPLTWWGVQFTISVATYVTAAAISVPYESIQKYDKGGWWNEPNIPENIKYVNKKFESNGEAIGEQTDCKNVKCISPKDFISKAGGMFSPLLVYSFSVFKIQDIKTINTTTDVVTSVMNIIHQGVIGVIMFIVYGLLVMALIFMLLMRAMKLWFYAIFSPLFTIKYVLGDKGFGDADKDGSFKITEFIGLAFVPAVVSLALGFGLIIVSALQSPLNKENPNNYCQGTKCTINIMGTTANQIVSDVITDEKGGKKSQTKVTIGGVTYTWEGSVTAKDGSVASVKSALGATGNLFGTIIIDIIALVFIWLAFMAGKGVSKAAGKAIEPFEAMGNKIGQLGMSLPKYTPLPVPGGSIAGMGKVAAMPEQFLSQRASDNTKGIEKEMGKFFGVDNKYKEADSNELKHINGDVSKLEGKINELKGRGIDLHSAEGTRAVNDIHDAMKGLSDSALSTHQLTRSQVENAKSAEDRMRLLDTFIYKTNRHKNENDIVKEWKEAKAGVNPPGTTNNIFNITPSSDGKSFNIGSVHVETSLDSDMNKIAEAMKKTGLKGNITEDELKDALKKGATQFQKEEKQKELIDKLGSEFFKKNPS